MSALSRRRLLGAALCLAAAPLLGHAAARGGLEVIELHHRPAEELAPLLRPFLDQDGTLTGAGFKLFVRTSPANLAELRRLVAELDTAPQRLRITVRRDSEASERRRGAAVSGRLPGGGQVEVYDSERQRQSPATQQVQVLEGNWASIHTGTRVPVFEQRLHALGVENTVRYEDVLSGFEVLPRVSGETVTLDIRPERAALNRLGNGAIDVQALTTTVSGKLGEWIDLGGTATRQEDSGSGILYRSEARRAARGDVQVKVERVQ